jgi:hypothetical protein
MIGDSAFEPTKFMVSAFKIWCNDCQRDFQQNYFETMSYFGAHYWDLERPISLAQEHQDTCY